MKKSGFSLIEVLVFVTILSLFFVAAMAVTVFSLRTMKTLQFKILATHLADETVEWVKSEKESNWTEFITHDSSSGTGTIFCLNEVNLDWTNQSTCDSYSLGTPAVFKREILIKNSGSPTTQTESTVSVSWIDLDGEKQVSIKSLFTLLE